ncbi:DAK2 domain-containing protein [Thermoleophilia bacterium SCSIO 60948]|nr:DAK2 domain-containing protein [Thermoleophilia bacterium SCSIO 60948]
MARPVEPVERSIERFRRVLTVALAHLEDRRTEINDLNVFPVADGDTGDNMALTMRNVLGELDRLERESDQGPSRPEIVHAVARAALMGARGNSGVILSQIVRGAAEVLATPPGRLIDPELIEQALARASEAAWTSVREPAEGTILSGIAAMAAAVREHRERWEGGRLSEQASFDEQNALLAGMMATALFAAEEAVRLSPTQLEVLAEADAVDAGALGLAVIVRGLVAGLAGEEAELPPLPHYAPARLDRVHHAEDAAFQFCTNLIVTGSGLDRESFVSPLEALGDSVLVVGDDETLKVHVHTDDPDAAKRVFEHSGAVIAREEIADMHAQVAEQMARLGVRTGVVAVASGEGMKRLFEERGAIVVDGGPTLNPSTGDIAAGIERAPGEGVLVLPNSRDVEMAAREAAAIAEREVLVIASRSPQAALSALVELDTDAPAAENAERIGSLLGSIRTGGVAPAAKDDVEGRFRRGDTVGFLDGAVIAWGGTGSVVRQTAAAVADGCEILTVIAGAGAPITLADLDLGLDGDVEVDSHVGDQPSWWWLLAAE